MSWVGPLSVHYNTITQIPQSKNVVGNLCFSNCYFKGRTDSVVRVATYDGLDGPVIEFRWRRDIPDPFKSVPRAIQPHVQWVSRTSPGDKAAGVWRSVPSSGVALTIQPL